MLVLQPAFVALARLLIYHLPMLVLRPAFVALARLLQLPLFLFQPNDFAQQSRLLFFKLLVVLPLQPCVTLPLPLI